MHPLEPIWTADLLLPLHEELMGLLRGLSPAEWEKPTVAVPWSVRDMVAHLLDTDIRRLSFQRDGLPPLEPEGEVESFMGLVAFLDQLNAEWVRAARRISPAVMLAFLSITGPQMAALMRGLDPIAPSFFPVAWAGEDLSPTWFDIAREYTEKWHHQQHIREAVGAPGLTEARWLAPVLDTFMRALPHTYRSVAAVEGTRLVVTLTGAAGGSWTLAHEGGEWQLYRGSTSHPLAQVMLGEGLAWRLFTKGISAEAARPQVQIDGDKALGAHLLRLLAIMA